MKMLNCQGCNTLFKANANGQKYCGKECRDKPRFYGRYCGVCGDKIYSSRGAQKKQETCSKSCAMLRRGSAAMPLFNEDYFSEPNLENSYWAGFIAADGCISDGSRKTHQQKLTINLSARDREHLAGFSKTIGGGQVKIYSYEREIGGNDAKIYSSAMWSKSSNKICNDLRNNYKVTPRKTLTLAPPTDLSYENGVAFIAGYIDGDGCYYESRDGLVIKILGTEQLLNWIADMLDLSSTCKKVDGSEVFVQWISGNRARAVQQQIQSLGVPLLKRKHPQLMI